MIYNDVQLNFIETKLRKKLDSMTTKSCLGFSGIGLPVWGLNFHIDCHWYDTNKSHVSIRDYMHTPGYQKRNLDSRLKTTSAILIYPLYDKQNNLTDVFWLVRLKDYKCLPPKIKEWL